MGIEQNSTRLPKFLMERLKSAKRVFLSVNPVTEYSDVLIDLEKQIATHDHTVDIVSVDKLSNLVDSVASTVLIACGDVPLRELPSYLGNTIHDAERPTVIAPVSVALRIHVSSSGNNIFEFLASDEIGSSVINICDPSSTQFSVLEQRFGRSQVPHIIPKRVRPSVSEILAANIG